MAVQARTLEFYRQLGIADDVVAAGFRLDRLHLRNRSRRARRRPARGRRQGHQPVPVRPQLPAGRPRAAADRPPPRGRPRRRVGHRADRLHAAATTACGPTLRKPGGEETWAGAYLCGCDGAHSAVRHGLGVGFPGGTYDQLFYVADAEAEGPWSDRDITAYLAEKTFCLAFPVRTRGHVPVHRPRARGPPGPRRPRVRRPPRRGRAGDRDAGDAGQLVLDVPRPPPGRGPLPARAGCSWPGTRGTSTARPAARG